MLFVDRICIDERIKDRKRDHIIDLVKNGKSVAGTLFIIRVEKSTNIFEIVSSQELYRLEEIGRFVAIVALVKDKDKAYEYVEHWIEQAYTKYGRILSEDLEKEFNINWE